VNHHCCLVERPLLLFDPETNGDPHLSPLQTTMDHGPEKTRSLAALQAGIFLGTMSLMLEA